MLTVTKNIVRAGRCLVPVYVGRPGDITHGWHVSGLLDTGATQSAITEPLAAFLNLPEGGVTQIAAAGQRAAHNSYFAHLEFWQASSTNTGTPKVISNIEICRLLSPVCGVQLLIGMDVIGLANKFEIKSGVWSLQWAV